MQHEIYYFFHVILFSRMWQLTWTSKTRLTPSLFWIKFWANGRLSEDRPANIDEDTENVKSTTNTKIPS